MSVWKQMVERRLGSLERNHELHWQAQRLLELEQLVGELRSVTFPDVARKYLAKRVLHVAEDMTDSELLALVKKQIGAEVAAKKAA